MIVEDLADRSSWEHIVSQRDQAAPDKVQQLRELARAALQALQTLHSVGLVHCDIRPETLLMYKEKYKVSGKEMRE